MQTQGPSGPGSAGMTNPYSPTPNLTNQTGGLQQAADLTAARQMLQQVNNAGQQPSPMQGTIQHPLLGAPQSVGQPVGQQGPGQPQQAPQFGSFGTFGGVFNNQQSSQQNASQNMAKPSGPVTGGKLF